MGIRQLLVSVSWFSSFLSVTQKFDAIFVYVIDICPFNVHTQMFQLSCHRNYTNFGDSSIA